jgi:hypothetical protein
MFRMIQPLSQVGITSWIIHDIFSNEFGLYSRHSSSASFPAVTAEPLVVRTESAFSLKPSGPVRDAYKARFKDIGEECNDCEIHDERRRQEEFRPAQPKPFWLYRPAEEAESRAFALVVVHEMDLGRPDFRHFHLAQIDRRRGAERIRQDDRCRPCSTPKQKVPPGPVIDQRR